MDLIPVAGPSITQREIDYVNEAVRTDWYGTAGRFARRFEEAFADYIGVSHAVSVPHCTSAIHLSLAALGVGPGDEVIVPDLTWIASAAPISYVGATPVPADVNHKTWCLCPKSFEANITEQTRAVIVVGLYGNIPQWQPIRESASRHGIAIIEDAAEAFGSEDGGRRAGSFGSTGVFSFHGSKTMSTGEGGMLVTNEKEIFDRVMVLRDHGRTPGDIMFRNHEVAFKYKMSGLQAALGLAQVERADELVAKKRLLLTWYRELLADIPELKWNPELPGQINSAWMSTMLIPQHWKISKETLHAELRKRGIDTRPMFYPLSSLDAYEHLPGIEEAKNNRRCSYELAAAGINLPSALCLERADVERVCDAVREIIAPA